VSDSVTFQRNDPVIGSYVFFQSLSRLDAGHAKIIDFEVNDNGTRYRLEWWLPTGKRIEWFYDAELRRFSFV